MGNFAKKHSSGFNDKSPNQLLLAYIRQVGLQHEADKSVQLAVKKLEKMLNQSY